MNSNMMVAYMKCLVSNDTNLNYDRISSKKLGHKYKPLYLIHVPNNNKDYNKSSHLGVTW